MILKGIWFHLLLHIMTAGAKVGGAVHEVRLLKGLRPAGFGLSAAIVKVPFRTFQRKGETFTQEVLN